MMTDNHIDHALHTVMERRAERIPALSDDFADQVMAKMNGRKEKPRPQTPHSRTKLSSPLPSQMRGEDKPWSLKTIRPSRVTTPLSLGERAGVRPLWVRLFAAAAILVLAFLLWPKAHETSLTPTSVQPAMVEVHTQPDLESSPVVEVKNEEALAQAQQAAQPAKAQRTNVGKKSTHDEPVPAQETPDITAEEGIIMTEAGYDEVDPKAQLYAAEMEQDEAVHQRQTAYEREMAQRSLELLISMMASEEEKVPAGGVKTQKS